MIATDSISHCMQLSSVFVRAVTTSKIELTDEDSFILKSNELAIPAEQVCNFDAIDVKLMTLKQ